ncbi:unnamed protein product [Ostreobium quekettii]|uniref:Tim44-like domain-containing protein n=1 Tax=Ostreobium quekettii TaxID=121088 RepID=A0A8S1JBW8_9CHLO|nr:unnamed protein product [Ostreobium quekettii]
MLGGAAQQIRLASRNLVREVDKASFKVGTCSKPDLRSGTAPLAVLSAAAPEDRCGSGRARVNPCTPGGQFFCRGSQNGLTCRSLHIQHGWAFGDGPSLRALSSQADELAKGSPDCKEWNPSLASPTNRKADAPGDRSKWQTRQSGYVEGNENGDESSRGHKWAKGSGDKHQQGGMHNAWANYSSWFKGPAEGKNSADSPQASMAKVGQVVWDEVKNAILPKEAVLSATRAREGTISYGEAASGGPSHLVVAEQRKSAFWKLLEDAFQSSPLFRRLEGLKDHQVFSRGREIAAGLRDRWEASDHPMMHKIQDVQDRLFTEPEAARVMREIRLRDPSFDMVAFLTSVKADIPAIITAYLEGKEAVLRQHCTQEMSERLVGMYRHYEAQGTRQDPTLLFVSDVELFDATYVEQQPVVVVTFSCQQINCLRDKFGNVVDGGEDEIHQVYYAWALQQDEQGAFGPGGGLLPPRWQLREMMIRGCHNLL